MRVIWPKKRRDYEREDKKTTIATMTFGAAMRKLNIIVPVDGMSDELYSEQYVAWHLVNAPGTGRLTTLTQINMIEF